MHGNPQSIVINGTIGIGGTILSVITSERAAIFAGCATGIWMLWQIGCSAWDRFRNK